MPDQTDLKQLLRLGAIRAKRYPSERQLDEAVQLIRGRTKIAKDDLQRIGETVAHDPEIFAATDIDDINTVLDSLGRE